MFDYIFLTGLVGSLVLVTGSAWPEGKDFKYPIKSTKNWLFAIGALILLAYSLLNYFFVGGAVFFVFLQAFVIVASIMMMLNTEDKTDMIVMSIAGVGFIIWSLKLSFAFNTIIFILGLVGVGLGYAFQMGTVRRELALVTGSVLIAIFSYMVSNWIFFWLNVFFAIFAGYYAIRLLKKAT